MSGNYRATKSGLSAEAQAKVESKYDPELASKAMEFLKQLLQQNGEPADFSTSGDKDSVHKALADGFVLAKVSNIIKPGSVSPAQLKPQKLPFKQMEQIGWFIDACKSVGIPDYELFQTVDLYEKQNLAMFITTLSVLARKVGAFGPKESQANKRNFTDEQMKAGQSVIGLQMGSNKGANQSGQNFGKGRMIVD